MITLLVGGMLMRPLIFLLTRDDDSIMLAPMTNQTYTPTTWHIDIELFGGRGTLTVDYTDSQFAHLMRTAVSVEYGQDCFRVVTSRGICHIWPHFVELGNGRYF